MINGLQEAITPTGHNWIPQPIQEKLSKTVFHLLLPLLPNNKLSRPSKQLTSPADMPPKLMLPSSKKLLLELQELIKLEVEPRTQEIPEDGELSGQLDH